MAGFVPKEFTDELLSRIDIVEVIGTRLHLKRAGGNFVTLCPFHHEKTPSFSVSQNKQFYHCFGCGASGNAISFLMQFEHLSFIEALENLSAQVGLTVPKSEQQVAQQKNLLPSYQLNERLTHLFEQNLRKSPEAIAYLKCRGLSGLICKQFRIGYAPASDQQLRQLAHGKLITRNLLQLGVLGGDQTRNYARFRSRIMFPIRNQRGYVIGFGGRTIINDQAKYLNSPESAIFHKGSELYGLYEARRAGKLDSLIVVEGYLDVVTLAQFGVTNVVATLGTAITAQQIQLLLRQTNNLIFCFDGDQAGRGAAWRALKNSLASLRDGLELKFLFLPEGEDPDSLIRKIQRDQFELLVKERAIALEQFFIEHLSSLVDLSTIAGKSKLAKLGRECLAAMPDGAFYQLLLAKIAEVTNLSVNELRQLKITEGGARPLLVKGNVNKQEKAQLQIPPELKRLINLLVYNPQLIIEIMEIAQITTAKITGIELLNELSLLASQQPGLTTGMIIEHWRERLSGDLQNLLSDPPVLADTALKNEVIGLIAALQIKLKEQEIQQLLAKVSTAEITAVERERLQVLIASLKR